MLDFRMPFINGLGFLYRLRSTEASRRRIPVIIVTGDAPLPDDVRTQFIDLGAQIRYKPITPEQLIDTIRAAVDSRDAPPQ